MRLRGSGQRGAVLRTGIVTVVILCVTIAGALVLSREHPNGVTTTLILVLVGGGSLAGLYLTWAAYSGDQRKAPDISLKEAANQLAVALWKQWEAEARSRRLNDPYPLPVSWSAADPALTDEWEVLEKLARSGAGWPKPLPPGSWATRPEELAGEGGGLADVLARIPTGRLLVLGEPGAGKTMLMVRLVLDMLQARRSDGAVPFLVPLASWNPLEQDLRAWLAGQLAVGRPEMKDLAPGGTGALGEALLEASLIVPILDGLDEVPDAIRGPAISRINDALRVGETVVVTCRTGDYRRAIAALAGPQINLRATAAAIQLRSLSADTVADYLIADAGGRVARARWEPVLEILGSNAPAAEALTTPLMAALARVIYNPRPNELGGEARDPAELCGSELSDRAAVEAHLFDAFIPAAYRGSSRWTAEEAEPWLRFLARYLEKKIGGPDLAWWKLDLVLGTPASARTRKTPASARTRKMLAFLRGEPNAVAEPSRRAAFRWSRLRGGAVIGLVGGLFLSAFFIWTFVRNWPGVRNGMSFTEALITAPLIFGLAGAVLGLMGGIVFGFAGVPDNLANVASPASVLARDRRATLVVVLIPAVSFGVIMGLLAGSQNAPLGLWVGCCTGLLVALGLASDMAWLRFVIIRQLLAFRHQLPSRLMSFLADAHQRGVLRQAGAVYQFRHIELQRRLAGRWQEPPKRWWYVPIDLSSNTAGSGNNAEPSPFNDAEPTRHEES